MPPPVSLSVFPCHRSQCLETMCARAVDAGEGGGSSPSSKCPLCRRSFTSADVMSGAELEAARRSEGNTPGGEGEEGPSGVQEGDYTAPPPKVAALLERWARKTICLMFSKAS